MSRLSMKLRIEIALESKLWFLKGNHPTVYETNRNGPSFSDFLPGPACGGTCREIRPFGREVAKVLRRGGAVPLLREPLRLSAICLLGKALKPGWIRLVWEAERKTRRVFRVTPMLTPGKVPLRKHWSLELCFTFQQLHIALQKTWVSVSWQMSEPEKGSVLPQTENRTHSHDCVSN